MDNIVFIVQQLSQPRCIKRIATIYNDSAIPIKVYGFDNGLYENNLKNIPFPIYEVINRDKTANKIKKVIFFVKVIRKILKENKKTSVFYLFGFEIGVISYLLHCRNYIYEEADVSAARFKNKFIRNLLLWLDRRVINNSIFTVLTSGGFKNYIFENRKIKKNIILMPNKLSQYFKENDFELDKTIGYSNIKFGFIGLIRYPNTIVRFAKIIGKFFPQHEFHFYGDVERKEYLDDEVKSYSNVFFHGPFVNPVDLAKVYSEIDINIVCYDTGSGNVNIAEPNKLYESIYFNTPIVVSKNTYLAERVKELGVGTAINASDDDEIISYVNSLHEGYYDNVLLNIKKIDKQTLIDNPNDLVSKVKEVVNI